MPEKDFKFYKKNLAIDNSELDKVCIMQPFLFQEVSAEVAKAKAWLDDTKLDKDTLEAEIKQDIRLTALKDGTKLTEGALNEQVSKNVELIDIMKSIISAKEDYDLWNGLLEAYNQRASMLKLIVRLLETDLYNIKNNSIGKGSEQHDMAREAIANNSKRRRRPQ